MNTHKATHTNHQLGAQQMEQDLDLLEIVDLRFAVKHFSNLKVSAEFALSLPLCIVGSCRVPTLRPKM